MSSGPAEQPSVMKVSNSLSQQAAFAEATSLMQQYRVPVVVEIILERVTNIAMGTEINAINEFESLAENRADAPTAISLLD